tara:strand:- start:1747 stop:1944 length:198 start_codon:yes stop_codon:yes gene_type:complete
MQDALIIVGMITMVVGASCLVLLSRLILIKIEKEKAEARAIEDYASRVDRAPILDLIYEEQGHEL